MILGLGGLPASDLRHIIERVGNRAQVLESARILVTGGTGFVGAWVVASLVEIRRQFRINNFGIEVLVRDEKRASMRLGREILSEVELTTADVNMEWMPRRLPSHVVHGATPSSLLSGSSDAQYVMLTSVLGTRNLINAVGNSRTPPRVIHLSSGAAYGLQPSAIERIPEDWSGGPMPFMSSSAYAEGKRAAEALLELAGREGILSPIQARLFAFLGPGLPIAEGFAIGNFIRNAVRGEVVEVKGDGSAVRSYLDARDLASWLLLLLIDGQPGALYNVGSRFGFPLSYWAELCAELRGTGVRYGEAPLGDRPYYVPAIHNSERLGISFETHDPLPALKSWMNWLQVQPSV